MSELRGLISFFQSCRSFRRVTNYRVAGQEQRLVGERLLVEGYLFLLMCPNRPSSGRS